MNDLPQKRKAQRSIISMQQTLYSLLLHQRQCSIICFKFKNLNNTILEGFLKFPKTPFGFWMNGFCSFGRCHEMSPKAHVGQDGSASRNAGHTQNDEGSCQACHINDSMGGRSSSSS